MAANFQELMLEMMKNPPDPNEALPTSNRKDTMYGATIPFHVCDTLWERSASIED